MNEEKKNKLEELKIQMQEKERKKENIEEKCTVSRMPYSVKCLYTN